MAEAVSELKRVVQIGQTLAHPDLEQDLSLLRTLELQLGEA